MLLHFYSVFFMFTQIGFASFRNLVSSFAKVLEPFCIVFLGASFSYFQNFENLEPGFQIFRFQTPKNVFWGLWTFWDVLYVQQFIDLFTILGFFYKFALILFISCSYEPSRQYGTSPFFKTSLKKSK